MARIFFTTRVACASVIGSCKNSCDEGRPDGVAVADALVDAATFAPALVPPDDELLHADAVNVRLVAAVTASAVRAGIDRRMIRSL
jgi:hypothetical protein